jgi:hypothetical protein
MLISSDAYSYFKVPNEYHFTNRTDADNIHPDWVVDSIVEHIVTSSPQFSKIDDLQGLDPLTVLNTALHVESTAHDQQISGYKKTLQVLAQKKSQPPN